MLKILNFFIPNSQKILLQAFAMISRAKNFFIQFIMGSRRIVRMIKTIIAMSMNISGACFTFTNHFRCDLFEIISLPDSGHSVNKHCCQIESPAKFRCSIIPWKGMMIIVETFADCAINSEVILSWINGLIISDIVYTGRETERKTSKKININFFCTKSHTKNQKNHVKKALKCKRSIF